MKNYNNEILNDCSWFAEKHRGKNKQSGAHWSTIIRFTKLFDEATRLQQRVDTLETYIADYCAPTISEKYHDEQKLLDEIKESNSLLRSALSIAKRGGKETNWEAFIVQLEKRLKEQHEEQWKFEKPELSDDGAKRCPFCGDFPSVWTCDGNQVVECKNESCPMYYEYNGSIFLDVWNIRK